MTVTLMEDLMPGAREQRLTYEAAAAYAERPTKKNRQRYRAALERHTECVRQMLIDHEHLMAIVNERLAHSEE